MSDHTPFPRMEGAVPVDAPGLDDLLRPDDGQHRFFAQSGPVWTDAMIARARRHIAGCITAVEMGFALSLGSREDNAGVPFDGLVQGHVWRAIDRRPDLLSDSLIAHFRTRAALSLMAAPAVPGDAGAEPMDAAVQAHCDGLALALARWTAAGTETTPMRADLPAEAMEELVWAVAGRMAAAPGAVDAELAAPLLAAINDAGQTMLARYDEQTAPIATAAIIARMIDRGVDGAKAAAFDPALLIEQGHYLLLCALIASRCGLETADVAQVIVHHQSPEIVRLLCHAAGFDPVIASLTLLALRPARAVPGDAALSELAEQPLSISRTEALARLAGLRVAGGFRAALARDGLWFPEHRR